MDDVWLFNKKYPCRYLRNRRFKLLACVGLPAAGR